MKTPTDPETPKTFEAYEAAQKAWGESTDGSHEPWAMFLAGIEYATAASKEREEKLRAEIADMHAFADRALDHADGQGWLAMNSLRSRLAALLGGGDGR